MATFTTTDRSFTPIEYGYLAVMGAQNIANGAVNNFNHPDYKGSSAAIEVNLRPLSAYFQYIALGVACYLFYAVNNLHAKEDVQKEIIRGIKEGFLHLKFDGKEVSLDFAPNLTRDIDAYIAALIEDYHHLPENRAEGSEICALAALHLEKFQKLYPFITKDDLIPLEVESANLATGLLAHIQNDLKLRYSQDF